LQANKKDIEAFNKEDQAMYNRLILNKKKVDAMITAIEEVQAQGAPVNKIISSNKLTSGLKVINKNSAIWYNHDYLRI
tara:strand:- start:106 stop:339 length:234 start_codon:yes stop_codon:yes gene_type:complete